MVIFGMGAGTESEKSTSSCIISRLIFIFDIKWIVPKIYMLNNNCIIFFTFFRNKLVEVDDFVCLKLVGMKTKTFS